MIGRRRRQPVAPPREEVEGFILAGGQSSRMGTDKALLDLGGRTVIERVIDAMRPVVSTLRLVTSNPEPYQATGLEAIPDRWPGAAALGGIGTAMMSARSERALVVACDLPFLTTPFLRFLVDLDPGADVTVCETAAEGLHPLCAVYSRRCRSPIGRRVGIGQLKVTRFFDEVVLRVVGEAELVARGFAPDVLANVNTPEEYQRALARLGARP